MNPARFGRYEVIREIARSNDIVYECYDPQMERHVAVKALTVGPNLTADERADRFARFKRECKAAARMAHPNVVTTYDYGIEDGTPFMVMQLMSGTLAERMASRPILPDADCVPIIRSVLEGLGHAHAKGVVHRDIKAGNVFYADDGTVKIGDFGVARLNLNDDLTKTNQMFGTPSYMAPEAWAGKPTFQSDLWSVGVLAFQLLTGELPFRGRTVPELYKAIDSTEPDWSKVGRSSLASLIHAALRKEPRDRATSAQELLDLFSPGVTSATISPRPPVQPPTAVAPSKTKRRAIAPFVLMGCLACGALLVIAGQNRKEVSGASEASPVIPEASTTSVLDSETGATSPEFTIDRSTTKKWVPGADAIPVTEARDSDEVILVFTGSHSTEAEAQKAIDNLGPLASPHAFTTNSGNWPPLRPGYWLSVAGAFLDQRSADGYGIQVAAVLETAVSVRKCRYSEVAPAISETAEASDSVVAKSDQTSTQWPSEEPPRNYYTLGSPEDEVLAVEGTPTSISRGGSRTVFHYKLSTVTLKDGLVTDYYSSYPELKIKVLPKMPVPLKDYYTLGSTEDEVLAIQGTPTSINRGGSRTVFHYNLSTVTLKDGLVTDYNSSYPELKIKVLPKGKR